MRWMHGVTIAVLGLSAATAYAVPDDKGTHGLPGASASAKSDKDGDKDKGKGRDGVDADKDGDKDKGKGRDGVDADKDGDKDKDGGGEAKGESGTQRQRRADHRQKGIDAVRAALGQGKVPAAANVLLRDHARISARLEMIATIFENSGKADLAQRALAALAKDDARFATKLASLGATGSPAAHPSAARSASSGGSQ